jgi:two-component system cell cycle sensor histidine kinase/response regulator CckA
MAFNNNLAAVKILIVEAQVPIAADLESRLNKLGYKDVAITNSGELALELAEKHHPDLVLMDVALEGELDGIKTAEVINKKWGIPVVFLAEDVDTAWLERAKLAYPLGCLFKPFQDWNLKTTIEMVSNVGKVYTERRKAEEDLRQSELLHKQTQRLNKTGGWEYDVKNARVTWTDEVYRIHEVSPDEYDPNDITRDISFYEDQEAIENAFRRAVEFGESYDLELKFRTAKGNKLWVRTIGVAELKNGKTVRVYGNILDITDRKQAELDLRTSEDRFKRALENIPDVIVIYDKDLRVQYINSATHRITGQPESYFLGKRDQDIWPPEVYQVYLPALKGAFETGEIHSLKTDLDLPGTGLRNLTITCVPLKDKDGEVREVLGITQDNTDRVLMERRYRDLFEEAPAMYVLTRNDDGIPIIEDCNELFLKTMGYSRDEVIEHPLADFYTPQSRYQLLEGGGYQRALTNQFNLEDRELVTADGRVLTTLLRTVPEIDAFGRARGTRIMFLDISEQKRAEEALRESEVRYRKLLELAPVGIAVHSEGKFVFTNPAGARILGGQSEEDIIGKPVAQFINPEMLEKTQDRVQKMISGGKGLYPINEVCLKLDGTPINVEVMATPLTYKGKPAAQVIVNDITERVLADKALRESEARFRAVFEQSTGGYSLTLPDGKLMQVNKAFADILGYTKQDLSDLKFENITHPDDHSLSMECLRSLLANEHDSYRMEKRYFHKDGSIVWAIVSTTLLRDEQNNPLYFITNIQDITERKRAEEELRKLSQAVEQSPASVMITDTTGSIEYVNAKFTNITGYTLDEVLGRKPSILKSGETTAEEYRELWETITAGREWHGEFHNRKKDGTLFWERASISPIRNTEGNITHFLAIKEDATGEKNLQEQLLQSQKMEAVGRLAGGIAHDFNNMLSVIIGHTQIAMQEMAVEDKSVEDDLQQVLNAAQRSADLTRQLLAFARKQTVRPQILNLNNTVSSMLKMLQRLIGENIELVWKPGPSLWPLKIDPAQIDQILANLSVNSRDAIQGVGNLTIETENIVLDETYSTADSEFVPGEYVQLAVTDTGSGMDRETLQHIFEPFFTTKKAGEGTGLGLATIYGIVKQNNGLINVYSEPGHGTIFKIYLPRTREVTAKATEKGELVSPFGTETVLLVEDEQAILKLGQEILVRNGYKVLVARTPTEAVDLAENHQGMIHLLVTDVVMPGMNGKELKDRLVTRLPGLKTLFMSGYTADVIARQGVLEAGVPFLQKPFSIYTLTSKVREILDQ